MDDIWREFDPNLDIPVDLKNARYNTLPDVIDDLLDPTSDLNFQDETLYDDDSNLGEDYVETELGVPSYLTIVSQTIRIASDGTMVVDIVLEVEDIEGADNYELRVTK